MYVYYFLYIIYLYIYMYSFIHSYAHESACAFHCYYLTWVTWRDRFCHWGHWGHRLENIGINLDPALEPVLGQQKIKDGWVGLSSSICPMNYCKW